MKQAFPMQAIASLAGLFDGSNRARGQEEAARASLAMEQAREAKRKNDYLSRENLDRTAADMMDWTDDQFNEYQNYKVTGGKPMVVKEIHFPMPSELPQGDMSSLGGDGVSIGTPQNTNVIGTAPQPAPDFLTETAKNNMLRHRQNLIAMGAMGGNGRMMVQNQMDFENRDEDAMYKAAAMNFAGAGNVDGANMVTSIGSGKVYQPMGVGADGLVYNKATGAVDTSNQVAQANIQNIGAKTALIGEQAYSEQFDRQKTAAEIDRIQNDIKLSLQKGDLDRVEFLTNINKEAFVVQQLGADGKPAFDSMTGKPIMAFDQQGYSRAIMGAMQSGLPANVVRAQEVQGGVERAARINDLADLVVKGGWAKSKEDLSRAVSGGQISPEVADEVMRRMKGGK